MIIFLNIQIYRFNYYIDIHRKSEREIMTKISNQTNINEKKYLCYYRVLFGRINQAE